MKPVSHYVVGGLCIVCATITHIYAPDGPITLVFAMAGTGVLVRGDTLRQVAKNDSEREGSD